MKRLTKGVFIVFEGIDGAGKSTQLDVLARYLRGLGYSVALSREPTAGEWGQKIRKLYDGQERNLISADEEASYFVYDRAEDVKTVIQPALAQKKVVLVDRYFYSNLAYQGARGASLSSIRTSNAAFPVPDLVFLIDIEPQTGVGRIEQGRGEKTNAFEKIDALTRVRAIFNQLDDPNIVRLDGTLSTDELQLTLRQMTLDYLRRFEE